MSEEEQRTDAATEEEAVDDVDLEVQRLLSVYDLVKDEESLSRLVHFYYITRFINMFIIHMQTLKEVEAVRYFMLSRFQTRPGIRNLPCPISNQI